jgi:hypothetical protein
MAAVTQHPWRTEKKAVKKAILDEGKDVEVIRPPKKTKN